MKIVIALAVVVGLAAPAAPALAASTPGAPTVNPTPIATAFAAAAPAAPAGAPARPGPAATTPAAAAATVAPAAQPTASTTAAPPTVPATAVQPAAGPAPVLVARYSFDGGAVGGHIADTSGRGTPLTVRTADQGTVRFDGGPTSGRYVVFPGICPANATACPRTLLEAPNDADLNPGTRLFRWSARVLVAKAQVKGSANIMQKGVANTGSQWKMQIGATQGRAQCVVVGVGSPTGYVVRSSVTVADGIWHKIICQRAGSTLTVYVDGSVRGTATIPSTLSISNTLPMRIGGPNFNTRSDMYHGLLDDVYAELG